MTATDPRVQRFRDAADRLQKQIDHAMRPMTQNPTPKRMREYNSRMIDGRDLQRTQRALRAIADAVESGSLPPILANLKAVKDVSPLVRKGLESNSYYEVHESRDYANHSDVAVALRDLIEGAQTAEQQGKDAERDRLDKIQTLTDKLRFVDIPGFFPTPRPLVRRMIELLRLDKPFLTVLEPSAGIGSIADELSVCESGRPSHAIVHCVELRPALREVLKAKQHELVGEDFLEFSPLPLADTHGSGYRDGYDRVCMNPPFENGQDIDHVRHAYDKCLKPGGRLVAIMSSGPFYRQDKKSDAFRGWLTELGEGGYIENLPDDTFKGDQAFRTTGVSCKLVVIDK